MPKIPILVIAEIVPRSGAVDTSLYLFSDLQTTKEAKAEFNGGRNPHSTIVSSSYLKLPSVCGRRKSRMAEQILVELLKLEQESSFTFVLESWLDVAFKLGLAQGKKMRIKT